MVPPTERTAPSPKAFAQSSPNLQHEVSDVPRGKIGAQLREKVRGA
jgi:hypothetical protein